MNIVEKTQKRIADLLSTREKTISEINARLETLAADIAEQRKALQGATERLDADAYSKAKASIEMLTTQEEMLRARFTQITTAEYVTEEESENTIAALLDYERELEKTFFDKATDIIAELKKLCEKQREDAAEAEKTLLAWTQQIRPNYISPTTTYPDGTRKSQRPVPVHPGGYHGGDVLVRINNFITENFDAALRNRDDG